MTPPTPVPAVGAAPTPADLQRAARELTLGRVALGAFVLVFPRPARRLFGFPAAHESDSAFYFARLYAVRELAMGLQLWAEASRGVPTATSVRVNAAVDGFDAAMSWLVVGIRPDIRRGALTVALFASIVTAQWLRLERKVARYEGAGRLR